MARDGCCRGRSFFLRQVQTGAETGMLLGLGLGLAETGMLLQRPEPHSLSSRLLTLTLTLTLTLIGASQPFLTTLLLLYV